MISDRFSLSYYLAVGTWNNIDNFNRAWHRRKKKVFVFIPGPQKKIPLPALFADRKLFTRISRKSGQYYWSFLASWEYFLRDSAFKFCCVFFFEAFEVTIFTIKCGCVRHRGTKSWHFRWNWNDRKCRESTKWRLLTSFSELRHNKYYWSYLNPLVTLRQLLSCHF